MIEFFIVSVKYYEKEALSEKEVQIYLEHTKMYLITNLSLV
jgi:hypothetical protein